MSNDANSSSAAAHLVTLRDRALPPLLWAVATWAGVTIAGPGQRLKSIEEQGRVTLAVVLPIAREFCATKTPIEAARAGMPCADLLAGRLPAITAAYVPARQHSDASLPLAVGALVPFRPSRRVTLTDEDAE